MYLAITASFPPEADPPWAGKTLAPNPIACEFESKIGNIEKIVFNNCANLRRIHDFVEGLNTISLNNCPNISEIDCYDKIKKIWIDKVVTTSISDFSKIMPIVVEKPKIVKEDAKKAPPPDYLIDSAFSCEIMEDPVVACDGITYNRSEIEEWFKKHDTSPKTGEILKSKNLIPNISIRNAIEEWKRVIHSNCNIFNVKI